MKNAFLFTPLMLAASAALICAVPAAAGPLNDTSTLVDESEPAPALPPAPDAAPQFAKVIDDLPLMPGLRVLTDDDVLFSTPRDRIAETEAIGPVDADDVYRFYRDSLPQLGWKLLDARHFRRENDVLRIDVKAEDKLTRVLFTVTPNDK